MTNKNIFIEQNQLKMWDAIKNGILKADDEIVFAASGFLYLTDKELHYDNYGYPRGISNNSYDLPRRSIIYFVNRNGRLLTFFAGINYDIFKEFNFDCTVFPDYYLSEKRRTTFKGILGKYSDGKYLGSEAFLYKNMKTHSITLQWIANFPNGVDRVFSIQFSISDHFYSDLIKKEVLKLTTKSKQYTHYLQKIVDESPDFFSSIKPV